MHNRDSAVFTSNVCKYRHRTQHSWSMTSILAFRLRVWMYHRLDTKKSQITALCYKNNRTTTYIALEITTKIKSQTPPATIYLQKLPDDDSSKSSLRKIVHLSWNHHPFFPDTSETFCWCLRIAGFPLSRFIWNSFISIISLNLHQ